MLYLDNAATSFPKPYSVARETARCIAEYCGNPGRGSHMLSELAGEKLYECRELVGKLLGARAENVAVTMNTTYALNIAIKSRCKSGSHVLISELEHNSVLRPVAALAKRGDITYDIFSVYDDHEKTLADIRSKLKSETKLIVATHCSNICGMLLPIGDIGRLCRLHGIELIVDAAQSAGIYEIDIDALNADVVCLPAHKGLYGVQGCGFMVTRNGLGEGETLIEGGSGVNSLEISMPHTFPERYEAGTLPTPAIAGSVAGLRWVMERGISAIASLENELSAMLRAELSRDPDFIVYGSGGGIVLFNLLGVPASLLGRLLADRGICVRSGYHCAPLAHKKLGVPDGGAVRVSFGAFNSRRDVIAFTNALRLAKAEARRR